MISMATGLPVCAPSGRGERADSGGAMRVSTIPRRTSHRFTPTILIATMRPAHIEMGPGQTADLEFVPAVPSEWMMHVRSVETGWYIPPPVIVAPRKNP